MSLYFKLHLVISFCSFAYPITTAFKCVIQEHTEVQSVGN